MWKCINCEHSTQHSVGTMTDIIELPRSGLEISVNYCAKCDEFQAFTIHGCIDEEGNNNLIEDFGEQKIEMNCPGGHKAEFVFGADFPYSGNRGDGVSVVLACSHYEEVRRKGGRMEKEYCTDREIPFDSRFYQIVPYCGTDLKSTIPIDPKAPGHPGVKKLYNELEEELFD